MSANKFKVGDKVKARKNLIEGRQYGCIYCNTDMAGLGLSGKTFTISVVDINAYQLEGYDFWWTDEMLELAERPLDNLCAGDFVKSGDGIRKILAALDGCYLLSYIERYDTADGWYTVKELQARGFEFFDPQMKPIKINGKTYNKADVKKAIKDLEPIDPSDTDS